MLFNAHTKLWKVSVIPTVTFFLKRQDSLGNRLKTEKTHFFFYHDLGNIGWKELEVLNFF